ncbi:MAG: NIL domain-containing protein [Sphingobacterium sp.]|nr:NIL domain-containing protein [Sphingobacterium sp.]
MNEPIVYRLVKDYDLKINILRAEVREVGGRLLMEVEGKAANIKEAARFLNEAQGRRSRTDKLRGKERGPLHPLRHVHLHMPGGSAHHGLPGLEGPLRFGEVHRLRHVHRRLPSRSNEVQNMRRHFQFKETAATIEADEEYLPWRKRLCSRPANRWRLTSPRTPTSRRPSILIR